MPSHHEQVTVKQEDLQIPRVGACKIKSPLRTLRTNGNRAFNFTDDADCLLFDTDWDSLKKKLDQGGTPLVVERAGPREDIFFDPSKIKAAIVTCGGLCPGINNVIRSLFMALTFRYGVKNIVGIKYGYQGFIPSYKHEILPLTQKEVSTIHQFGGTILGSSRGEQDVPAMVDCLERENINMLFTIGGDGTLRGALAIAREIEKRGLKISVAGIPKTIDNDINFIEKTFGFETSFSIASPIIRDAHNEARGYFNGIAIVKLMGRDAGFIAANAALAMPEVNFVLVPEFDFDLEGPKGLLEAVRHRLERSHHCLIVVAEGAGQNLFANKDRKKDPSGNILHEDIGILLKDTINRYFKERNTEVSVKYIDPSYIIRSAPATPSDSIFCTKLAFNAVHGAMAGKTAFVVGRRNNEFVYLPMKLVTAERKQIDINSSLWMNVLETTGQPAEMRNHDDETGSGPAFAKASDG